MKKEKYIAQNTAYIKAMELICANLTIIKQGLLKFDNKVFNKRIITSINPMVTNGVITKDENNITFALLKECTAYNDPITGKTVYLSNYQRQTSFRVVPTDQFENRINAYETNCIIDKIIDQHRTNIQNIKNNMENFDVYMALNEEIKKQIKLYEAKIPNNLRLTISIYENF